MSTFLQLVQQFYREVGLTGPVPTSVISQSSQKRLAVDWVAEAEYVISSKWFDWDFMWSQHQFATVAGTANYSAPADLGTYDIESFYLNYTSDTNSHLSYLPYKDWRSNYRQGTKTNALSDQFTILPDNTIQLEPPPDAAYNCNLDYWKEPTRMSADADTSNIPTRLERVIILRAKMMHGEHFGDNNLLNIAAAEYGDKIRQLEADQLPDRHDRLSQSPGHNVVVVE